MTTIQPVVFVRPAGRANGLLCGRLCLVGVLLAFDPNAAWAAAAVADGPPGWGSLSAAALGGLALFLFGMDQLSTGLKASAGPHLRSILAKTTSNRVLGSVSGAVVTAIVQSSSVTTVLVVGFVSAGLMTLSQSIGVIIGANVGTTVTAQIVAFNITAAGLPMIAAGFALLFFLRSEQWKSYGRAVMGLGLVFFGMGVMGEALAPLRAYPAFVETMASFERPLVGIIVGALFTAVIQSSSATTSLAVALASQGLLSLTAGIALALGANIGTCVTALLACIGKQRDAKRAAVVHVVFNVAGVLLWLGLIDVLAVSAVAISPSAPALVGLERLAAEAPRQIANANTLFNLANAILFLGLTPALAWLVRRIVPDQADRRPELWTPRYLDDRLLEIPGLGLERVRLEIGHMADLVSTMLSRLRPALQDGSWARLEAVEAIDADVDALHDQINDYLRRMGQQALSESAGVEFIRLMDAAKLVEDVGDIIKNSLVRSGKELIQYDLKVSPETRSRLSNLYDAVWQSFDRTFKAFALGDRAAAEQVIVRLDEIEALVSEAYRSQARRLTAAAATDLMKQRIEISLIDKLRQIYLLSRRVAEAMVAREPG